MSADEVTLASLLCTVHAQQPDNVTVVRVEELARRRAVDAHLVDLRRVVADVLDVPQDVAAAVLGKEVADMGSEAHVCNCGLVGAPLRGGEALEEDEALAVEEVFAKVGEGLAQDRKRKEFLEGGTGC